MSMCLPAQDWMPWLNACRLSDSALAEAYEATPSEHRACVKHCLALWHHLYGEDSEEHVRIRRDATLGLQAEEYDHPAPWALVVLTPDYAAPTRLAAVLMPAILAKVPLLGVVCAGGPPSLSTRVTLELAGVEHIFCVQDRNAAARCVHDACTLLGQGSVALLHKGELGPVATVARQSGLPLWEECRPPSIAGLEAFTCAEFCHPDAHNEAPHDASFGVNTDSPLQLAAGMESFWRHAGLTKTFFRRKRLSLTPHCPIGENS